MKIAFLGDIYTAGSFAVPKLSDKVCEHLSACDHVVANLEGPVTTAYSPIIKTGPVMRQNKAVLNLFNFLNVDIVGLANNHIMDHDSCGLKETIQTLENNKLKFGGAGFSVKEIYKPIRVFENGLTISLLFAAENGFGCVTNVSDKTTGYGWVFHNEFNQMLAREVAESDFVVAYIHAGVEHIDRPLLQWRMVYRNLIDSGAHAVIAHHPHLTQGIELYKGAPIFYSIGNFYFNEQMPMPHWHHAQIPILRLELNRSVEYELIHTRFELGSGGHIAMDDTPWGNERTERLSYELVSSNYSNLIHKDLEHLWGTRYGKSFDASIDAFSSARSMLRAIKRVVFELGGRGQWQRNPERLEALLEIESHRWAISETMRGMYQRSKLV